MHTYTVTTPKWMLTLMDYWPAASFKSLQEHYDIVLTWPETSGKPGRMEKQLHQTLKQCGMFWKTVSRSVKYGWVVVNGLKHAKHWRGPFEVCCWSSVERASPRRLSSVSRSLTSSTILSEYGWVHMLVCVCMCVREITPPFCTFFMSRCWMPDASSPHTLAV